MTPSEFKTFEEIFDWCQENKVKYMRIVYDNARENHPEWFPVIRKARYFMISYLASVRRSRWR